jgi:acyl transferase domain-containing protein
MTPQVPVAVVGIGALLPGAVDAGEFWCNLVTGRDLMTDVPASRWRVEDYYDPDPQAPDKTYGRRGAFLPAIDFDPMRYGIPPNDLPAIDTTQLLALAVADQVLADCVSGLPADRERVSVLLGAPPLQLMVEASARLHRPVWLKVLREHGVAEPAAQAMCDDIAASFVPWREETFPGLLTNVVAGRIANKFDLHGTNHTTDAACASSFAALHAAIGELALHRADLVITGGVDTMNDITMYVCFSRTPALSPSGDCRPFADGADGTMLGEGIVMFALKRLADAERDGDRVYAVIRGVGTSSDGRGTAIYAPLPAGQVRALRRAYQAAGYGPETVGLVEAHGTGTSAGDAAEVAALREVFDAAGRPDRPWCALGSVKSQIGHTKAAAGAAGLLKAVLALHHQVLPPTIKVDRPNPGLGLPGSPLYLNTRARPWVHPTGAPHPRRASVSSFGFGGSNFHVTLEEYTGAPAPAGRLPAAPTELVLLSAGTPGELLARVQRLDLDRGLPYLARASQQEFRATDPVRLAVVAADRADLAAGLAAAGAHVEAGQAFSVPGRVHCVISPGTGGVISPGAGGVISPGAGGVISPGAGGVISPGAGGVTGPDAGGPASAGRLAFLFPGQGAQRVGMGADLAMHLRLARSAWDDAARLEWGGVPLHAVVFPPPAFTPAERAEQEARLTATEWAQPALAVHSLALLAVLGSLGVTADCLAGHSFGELVALHAAGAFDADTLVRLARRRGELMRDVSGAAGGMLAVVAPAERAEAAAAGVADVWLANLNAPRQVVLAGTAAALETVAGRLAAEGITAVRLKTATGFHSPLVASASEPLLGYLRAADIQAPALAVYGNRDACEYPADPDEVRHRLAAQLAAPVRFIEVVEAMYARGVRTFLEVGAGATLTDLVGQILGDRPHAAISLDPGTRHGMTSLQDALGRLAVSGVAMDFAALWADCAPPATKPPGDHPKLTVRIDGGNYGRPYPPPERGTATSPAAGEQRPAAGRPDGHGRWDPAASDQRVAAHAAAPATPPGFSAVEPGVPASGSGVPAVEPGVPASGSGVPAVEPGIPASWPSVPAPPSIPADLEPQPAASRAGRVPVGPDEGWLRVLEQAQRQAADAHAAFQRAMTESHLTYLRMAETTFAGILGAAAGEPAASVPGPAVGWSLPPAGLPEDPVAGVPGPAVDGLLRPAGFPGEPAAEAPRPAAGLPGPAVDGPLRPAGLPDEPPSPSVAVPTGTPLVSARPPAGTRQPPTGPAGLDADGIRSLLLSVVAEHTGFPVDLINIDMELQADLGIDSIKRVEILSAVRKRVGDLPAGDLSALATLPTLRAVADRVGQLSGVAPASLTSVGLAPVGPAAVGMPEVGTAPAGPASADGAAVGTDPAGPVAVGTASVGTASVGTDPAGSAPVGSVTPPAAVLATGTPPGSAPATLGGTGQGVDGSEPLTRRVVRAVAAPPSGLAMLGLTDGPLAVTDDGGGVAPLVVDRLAAHGIRAQVVTEVPADAGGVLVLDGLRPVTSVEQALSVAGAAFRAARQVARRMEAAGGVFVTVQDTGGDFGLSGFRPGADGSADQVRAWLGGLAGLARTAAKEWPLAAVKAIDCARGGRTPGDLADALAGELVGGGGAGAVGLRAGGTRVVLDHAEVPIAAARPRIGPHSVIVATGGARGVTAAALRLLAVQCRPRLVLLGRTPLTAEPEGLLAGTDEAGLIPLLAAVPTAPLPAPGGWERPADLAPLDHPYDGRTLFHGPRLQAIRATPAVSAGGAEGTVAGSRLLGWAGASDRVDPASLDGGLQLAVLWAQRAGAGPTLPMGVRECRVYRQGAVAETARCVVRGQWADDSGAECDVALLDGDGVPRVELLGVRLVRRPD